MNQDLLQKFYNLKITDKWLFPQVFGNAKNILLSKEMIERCIGRKIETIQLIIPESSEDVEYGSHGVRFDVKFIGDKSIYIVEMQNYSDFIMERSEYYHSVEKVKQLKSGQKYNKLKPTYVIFICTFDYFEIGEAKYILEWKDINHPELNVNGKSFTILLNSTGKSDDKKLLSFLTYLNTSTSNDPFTESLDEEVRKIKENEVMRSNFMTFEEIKEEERYQGKKEGISDTLKTICSNMIKNNESIDKIVTYTGATKEQITEILDALKKESDNGPTL